MKEIVLKHFFEGHASAKELADDLVGTRDPSEPGGFRSSVNYRIVPMAQVFKVEPRHIIRLVDAVADGSLSSQLLGDLCFCLECTADRFLWDTDALEGERVANALFWLGTPEINYPLTPTVLGKMRRYISTGENTLERTDLARDS